jgi:RNA polymerase sigma-70 factor (ECF subfamily)
MNQTSVVSSRIEITPLEPAEFTRIVEENQKPVFNLCYRMLGDPNDAEDAAQETFWKAYKNYNRYDPSRSLLTWLLSIAAHHCIDQIRKRRMKTISIDLFADELLPDSGPTPEKASAESDEKNRLRGLLRILAPDDRAAIVMRYWYDFSDEEIGTALKLSVSAVKSRLFRARKQIALVWQKTQGENIGEPRRQHEPLSI